MTGRLDGKVAIVTGGGSIGPGWGNGKATAVTFAREGARVLVVDNRAEAAAETVALIEAEKGTAAACAADVSRDKDVARMVAECVERWGRVDILHNNVGIVVGGGPEEVSDEAWSRGHEVNVTSVMLACRHVLPHMKRQRTGVILNVSSIASQRWLGAAYISYNATKGALNAMTRALAAQYGPDGIRCNSILPGLMRTPLVEGAVFQSLAGNDPDAFFAERARIVPLRRFGDGWDTANAALFLASDEARYITGIELLVDGGVTIQAGV
ncbi:MAG: SDR family NAD(P)-dependent oxidoreductase [Alphaproteobacteria bacterium]